MQRPIRITFQKRLLISYVLVLLIPFLSALLIFGIKSYKEVKTSHADFMLQLIKQTNHSIDNFFAYANRITLMNVIDNDVARILKKRDKQQGTEYVEDLRIIRIAIDHAIYLNPDMSRVTFVGMNGNIYSNDGADEAYMSQINPWYLAAEKSKGDTIITPVYDGVFFHNPSKLISIVRMLTFLGMRIGYVNIDINFNAILDILGATSKDNDYVETLLIEGDKVIYDSLTKSAGIKDYEYGNFIHVLKNSLDKQQSNVIEYKINGVNYLIAASYNHTTNWIIAKYIPLDIIGNSYREKIGFYTAILLASLILAFLCAYAFSVRINKPILKMKKSMKLVEMGNINVIQVENERIDEIGELIQSYNKMIIRLNDSIQNEYLANIHQKKIEFQMLQAQINPHFLYNTLNVIGSIAEINGIDDIADLTNNLSKMFRYNITQKDFVQIRAEIEQVNHYLRIQQTRFPGKIQVTFEIDEPLYNYSIMKFSLQPFVENAIYHGIEPKGGKGSLLVSIKLIHKDLLVTIQDNGGGIPEARLLEINQSFTETIDHSHQQGYESIGIKNVHLRIRGCYGEPYGVQIVSSLNEGTTVRIRMPAMENEKEGEFS